MGQSKKIQQEEEVTAVEVLETEAVNIDWNPGTGTKPEEKIRESLSLEEVANLVLHLYNKVWELDPQNRKIDNLYAAGYHQCIEDISSMLAPEMRAFVGSLK